MMKRNKIFTQAVMWITAASLVLTCGGVTAFAGNSGTSVEQAEARVTAAKEAVSAAQDALTEAQEALDAAADKYDAGAFAFFENVGASSALDVLNNAPYSSYTEKGNAKDATSFSNMLASIDFLRECNDLRKSEGCSELKVSYYMMAIAMSDTNASAYTMGHTQQYSVGENLAWGYKDPFAGWYTEEKAEYDAGDTNFSNTGHYQNIVNGSYAVTGFAMNQYGSYGVTHGQVFQFSSSDVMSVDAYEKELTTYIASLDQDTLAGNVSAAEAALADAKEEQSAAEEALEALLNGSDTSDGTSEDSSDTGASTDETKDDTSDAEDPNYGFSVSQLSSRDTFKVDHAYSTHEDGSNTFQIYFFTDGDESWIDKNVTFQVEDVTSNGVIQVMKSAGISYVEPKVSIDTADGELSEAARYHYVRYVTLPIGEDGPILGSGIKATSGKEITVEAGQSTRCVKVTAYKDGQVIDYTYCRTSRATDGGYSAADQKLYECACASIEAQLWTSNMTRLQKLQAFADYVSSVSHYPNSDTTKAEYNPEWAAKWGEDGISDGALIWWDFADQYVDWTMALQGGQSTCLAANMLYDIAVNDLGLKAITVDDTGAGEGVYVGIGKNSSNPTNSSHYSLVYQAADGTRTFVDAQGMDYSSSSSKVTCSAHGCESKIIPISNYAAASTSDGDPSDGEEAADDEAAQGEVEDTVVPDGETEPAETEAETAGVEDDAAAAGVVEVIDDGESDETITDGTDAIDETNMGDEDASGEPETLSSGDDTDDLDGKEGDDTTAVPYGVVEFLDDTAQVADSGAQADSREHTSRPPKTGDTNDIIWYLGIAMGAAGLAIVAVVIRRKRQKEYCEHE